MIAEPLQRKLDGLDSTLTPEQIRTMSVIGMKLLGLGCNVKMLPNVSVGPIVSVYRLLPQGSTKVSHLEALASDLAVALGVEDILIKRLPGESAVAVFVPNTERTFVDFKTIVTELWKLQASNAPHEIPLAFGVDHTGKFFCEDLALLPHLLIAGTTGSGKSTLLSSLLASIVYCVNSSTLKLVLSDTTNVEFTHFIGAPHLLFPPAINIYQTLERMDWLLDEMEDRLKKIAAAGVRNIAEYNAIQMSGAGVPSKRMPRILFLIDELADLLCDDRKGDGEKKGPSLGKVAQSKLSTMVQKSRKSGIHVIASTQRPSVDIVKGSIKSNFPARLTFRLPSDIDSRTVINTEGAEHLLARGDMLYSSPLRPTIVRLHSPFASIKDIEAAVEVSIQKEAASL